MSNNAIIEAYKKMSKAELALLAMSTGAKIGYLVDDDFVSKEEFETTVNDLVSANKKHELAVLVSELGSKQNLIDKSTMEGFLRTFGANLKTRFDT